MDQTKRLLADFEDVLVFHDISRRISMENTDNRYWPYGTSARRTRYLAAFRNKALEPLQSSDESIRLPDTESFTKIVFLNDIFFTWQSIVRLLATRLDGRDDEAPDYDLVCGIDYGSEGEGHQSVNGCSLTDCAVLPSGSARLYDTWVARDVCGIPLRSSWPYFKNAQDIARLGSEMPVEVASCWNGVVAFPAEPYIRKNSKPARENGHSTLRARGWHVMDSCKHGEDLLYAYICLSTPFSYVC